MRLQMIPLCLLAMGLSSLLAGAEAQGFPPAAQVSHFARLALKCARQEYPNKLDHVMNGPAEVLGPKALHPAFYGCFDWHSAVHGHWVMVRVLREHPGLLEAAELRRVLDAHLAPGPMAQEVAYLGQGNRASFERTYGWAWLLKLAAELHSWDSPDARRWEAALQPLTVAVAARFKAYLPKATYPIRTGVHPNTAYSLNLALDYARAVQDRSFEGLIAERARTYFGKDQRAPLAWEPGAEDFLSPTLEEAALMARLLPASAFRKWLPAFLPGYALNLQPAQVSDRSDPKIVHLDGLNLSRARCAYLLAATFPEGATRRGLIQMGDRHAAASLPHIATGSYEGEHWLGTFALHLLEAKAALGSGAATTKE